LPYSAGTFSLLFDFDTEAASPPIEIAKLTDVCNDIATGLSSVLLRDGTGLPTADLNFNGQKITNAGAATTLTGYARVTEIIDQDMTFYVDSGSANVLVITPSPAIAAYEEGQRFVIRAAANNSGATTLNVNGLGPIAVQTPDGVALASGAILLGGLYEFTYDANAAPDRWVLTSPPSEIPDGMLSSNIPLKNAANAFSVTGQNVATGSGVGALFEFAGNGNTSGVTSLGVGQGTDGQGYVMQRANLALNLGTNGSIRLIIGATGNYNFGSGTVTTDNTTASEPGYKGAPSRNVTSTGNTAATDAGGTIRFTGGSGQTFTLDSDPPADSVVVMVNSSGNSWTIAASGTLTFSGNTGSRTLATGCMCAAIHASAGNWNIAGQLT